MWSHHPSETVTLGNRKPQKELNLSGRWQDIRDGGYWTLRQFIPFHKGRLVVHNAAESETLQNTKEPQTHLTN